MEHLDPEVLSFLKFIGGGLAVIVTLCIGAFFIVVTIIACAKIGNVDLSVSTPHCPFCEKELRSLEVQSVNTPFPSEARWICANYYCKENGHLFSDKEGKPEPLPAKPERFSEI